MENELRDLYQQVILDHNKNPRNFGKPALFDRSAEGYNPLCGDHLHLYLSLDGDTIKSVSFDGSGCAISKASASIMTGILTGKKIEEVEPLFEQFQHLVTADKEEAIDLSSLGQLAVFAGVREFPARENCASHAWHPVRSLFKESGEQVAAVSTE